MAEATPPLLDLTVDNITPNAIRVCSASGNPRLNFLMDRLITHIHDFARETRLTSQEWMGALDFLVRCGQISSDVRHEFILLSDILALSPLVDAINHPKPASATEGSNLGPFHTHDAPTIGSGASMTSDPNGQPMLVICSVKDVAGNPIRGAKIDIWETDSSGHYDVQYDDRGQPSERCVISSDDEGGFWFKAIRPVSYPIPNDGPVGQLLGLLKRHCWRPAHLHFMFDRDGYDQLITALFMRGDKYETSDAVFGVKKSLIVDLEQVDALTADKYGVAEGSLLLKHDFVLVQKSEADEMKVHNSKEAMRNLGIQVRLEDQLPVLDVD